MKLVRRRKRSESAEEPEPAPATSDYHCMTIHLNEPGPRDEVAEAWEQAGGLVDYTADFDDRRADRRRDDIEPGDLSAAVLQDGHARADDADDQGDEAEVHWPGRERA